MDREGRRAHADGVATTLNSVPFAVEDYTGRKPLSLVDVEDPKLSNVAGSLLTVLGYRTPEGYLPSLLA